MTRVVGYDGITTGSGSAARVGTDGAIEDRWRNWKTKKRQEEEDQRSRRSGRRKKKKK